MSKTKYFYKGKKIDHLRFLQLMKENGLISGWRISHWHHLQDLAKKGNKKAVELLKDLKKEVT